MALADSSGNLNTSYTHEPFGNTTISGSSGNPYQFTGRENDGTALYYYRARYYSPTFQRFISLDPIGFGGGAANLYSYAAQDPALFVDPLGWLNFLFGGGASAVAPTGAEGSGGIYINPGLFGQQADFGAFATVGARVGVNISAGAFGGVVFGGAQNLSGLTVDSNLVLGPISVTTFTNPTTGAVSGFTLGLGPSATPIGASGTVDLTRTFSILNFLKRLLGVPRPCP